MKSFNGTLSVFWVVHLGSCELPAYAYKRLHLQTCSMFLISKTTIWSEHLELIKFYLNQRADKNIKADEQRALSCKMERQNLNSTRLDPLIKK